MPIAFSETQARRTGQVVEGAFPLYPDFNKLLTRNPETLKYANEGYSKNSLVFNCITRRAQAIHQAPLVAVKKGAGTKRKKQVAENTDLQKLLENPNPYMDQSDMMQYISIYADVGGKAYLHKVRDSYGVVRALYPYHASQISIQQGVEQWVDGYWYDNGAGFKKFIPPEDMGVFKFPSINFIRPYTSESPLKALASLVDLDSQVVELSVALLLNGGAPPFVIYPGEGAEVGVMTQDQLDRSIEAIITKLNGRNRGKPLLMNKDFQLEKVGYSPKEMLLTEFSQLPETRVCAVYGVPVGYAQMLTGLEYAGTYANRETDKLTMYEDAIIPAWMQYQRAFMRMFKDETFYDGRADQYDIEFDYSNIPALMETDSKLVGKVVDQWRYNLIPRDRALDLIGEDMIGGEDGKKYYSEVTGTAFGTVDDNPKTTPAATPKLSVNGHGLLTN